MFFIDTHCHIDFEWFDEDRAEVVEKAKQENVKYLVNIGCETRSNIKVRTNSQTFENVFYTAGIHPSDVEEETDDIFQQIIDFSKDEKMVAVGEIGLDYYKYDNDRSVQKHFFKKAIETAHQINKPIVVHDRDAHEDVYTLLKDGNVSSIGGVMHCFGGDAAYAKEIIDLGMHISLTGVITFKNANYDEIIETIPMERLMLETDAPFLTPHPYRGKRNDPSYLPLIAEKIATVKGLSVEDVMTITTENAIKFFKLPIRQ